MNAMSSTTTSQVLHPGRGVLVEICISSNAKSIKPINKYRFITPNMIWKYHILLIQFVWHYEIDDVFSIKYCVHSKIVFSEHLYQHPFCGIRITLRVRFHLCGAVEGRTRDGDRWRLPLAVVRFHHGGFAAGPSRIRRGSTSRDNAILPT